MMQKLKKIVNSFIYIFVISFLFSFTIVVVKELLCSFPWYKYDYFYVVLLPFWAPLVMEGFPGGSGSGSSSWGPQSEQPGSAPAPTGPPSEAEPTAPAPDVDHPLMDDNTRHTELEERAGFHFAGLAEADRADFLEAQLIIDRAIEKALLSDGYSRDELNELSKRNEIRGFIFYPKGKLMSLQTYHKYVREVQFGTHRSKPYQEIIDAIYSSKLFLKKIKKHKKWELGQVWEQWGGRR